MRCRSATFSSKTPNTRGNERVMLKFMKQFRPNKLKFSDLHHHPSHHSHKDDTPWVRIIWETYYQDGLPCNKLVGSFWWKGILQTLPEYKKHSRCIPGKGETILLWHDNWSDLPLHLKMPELHSSAINKDITLNQIHEQHAPENCFH